MDIIQNSLDTNIAGENLLSFECYNKLVAKYMNNDWREINFQNRVIIPFLEKLFEKNTEIEVVDVSTQYKNRHSSIHSRDQYAGDSTPDILIVSNWTLNNIENKVEYLAAVEVKSPCLNPIYNREPDKYRVQTIRELKSYLSIHSTVILTDCIKWQFFNQEKNIGVINSEEPLIPFKTINLWENLNMENKALAIDERIKINITETPKEWAELHHTIFSMI